MKQTEEDLSLKSESPDEHPDVDRTVELRAMANMLQLAQGFTIAFAQCNQPAERRRLVSKLRQLLGDHSIAEIEFTESIEHLLDELIPRLPEYENAGALFIYGLERSIHSDREFSPLVANLNVSRNLFPRYISYPIVLWLPVFAVTAVMRGAPDFFSWRSASFQFPSPPEMLAQVSQDALAGDAQAALNLTLEEKKERIAVIEDLLAEYESLPPHRRDHRTESRLLYRLAALHYSLGDYAKAEVSCHRGLEIDKELNDKGGIATFLLQLGIIAQERGNYEKAEDYYGQSLKIGEELGDKEGIGISLHNLGVIAHERGDHEKAESYYGQSLRIEEELGNKRSIATSLHQLGIIAYERGDYDKAEGYYGQSLKIKEELGNKRSIAASLHQLGMIAQERGDYEKAESYYGQSLRIEEELGNKRSIATSLHQLGIIAYERGEHERAAQLVGAALAVFEQIGSPYQEIARRSLTRLQGQIQEARFEALLKEAQADPERVVRDVLESGERKNSPQIATDLDADKR